MADTWRFSVSVAGAVVRQDGRLLAIQREDNGHWEPPGGLVEPGESLTDTLVREVLEETGVHVAPGPLSGVYQNMQRDIIAFVFRCSPDAIEPNDSDETRSLRWLTPEEVAKCMDEAYAVRLLDALDSSETHVRSHDGASLIGSATSQR